MADDIVIRLRQPGRNGGVCYCDDIVYGPCADCKERNEAADEIERLRAIANYARHNDGCEQPLHGIQRVCNCGLLDLLEARRAR